MTDLSNVLLIGTGSKCLSTNIGFVGCNDYKVIEYLKYYSSAYMFTNAINPVQAATSLANLRILRTEHGRQLRKKVLENYHYLRPLPNIAIICRKLNCLPISVKNNDGQWCSCEWNLISCCKDRTGKTES